MYNPYGIEALKNHWDKMIEKGEVNPETGKSRKNAVLRGIKLLPGELQHDLRKVNQDEVVRLLAEKYGPRLKDPSTIYTYQKRFMLGFKSFLATIEHQSDPLSSVLSETKVNESFVTSFNNEQVTLKITGSIKPDIARKLQKLIDANVEA